MSYTYFEIRDVKPEKGNVFYRRTATGGVNTSIQGSPVDECDVLSNCVGYAQGRFNEIHFSITGKKENICKTFNCNAEGFYAAAKKLGFGCGQEPRPGAIACWQKGATLSASDGAGHVAVVEVLYADGSILVSESAWGGKPFALKRLSEGGGCWGYASPYKFLGFIYHPDVIDSNVTFCIGDKVNFTGTRYYVTSSSIISFSTTPGLATIVDISKSAKHPYKLTSSSKDTNVSGWVNKEFVQQCTQEIYSSPTEKCTISSYVLKRGTCGELVGKVQVFLGLPKSGDFDSKTEDAVKSFQTKHGLTPDGIVGGLTWSALLSEEN